MHDKVVVVPESAGLAYRSKFSKKDFYLHEKESPEDDKVEALLNEVEEIINPTKSQKIEDESAGKDRGGNENLVSFIKI